MKFPTLYRYQGRWWHGGFERHGMTKDATYMGELLWLCRHGKFYFGWQWPELIFGLGRDWYDGPIWFVHFGILSISLTP